MKKKYKLDRKDGYFVKEQSPFSRLFNSISPRRCDNIVYFRQTIDVENIKKYIDKSEKKISMLHILTAAIAKTVNKHENLNRYVYNGRIYQHKDLTISTIIKKELSDNSPELIGKFKIKESDNIKDISQKLTKDIKQIREEKDSDKLLQTLGTLPTPIFKLLVGIIKFLINIDMYPKSIKAMDPTYCSIFVANLGSIGLEGVYHHLYEWGTCSIFVTMGVIKKQAVIVDNEVKIKDTCEVIFSIDERIGEGMKFATALKTFKEYIENPELLEK